MIALIYSVIVLVATILGSFAGLGGGVIIKPLFDLVGIHNVATIGFLSSCAVLSMAIHAILRQLKNGVKFEWGMILNIGVGAIIGGNIGNQLLAFSINVFAETTIQIFQAIVLSLLLIFTIIVIYNNFHLCLKGYVIYIFVGIVLGMISSFLGIGGGPINVAVFTMFFNIELKRATIFSLATILFSQISKLLTIFLTTGFSQYDCSLLIWIIPTAILGGIIGSYFNKVANEILIKKIFSITVLSIIFLNIYIVITHI